MFSFEDILKNCDRSLEAFSKQAEQYFIRHRRQIDTVINILDDNESKYVYAQEISSLILRSFLQPQYASYICGLISNKEFDNYVTSTSNHEMYSKIATYDNPIHILQKKYCIVTTFILEQYRYKNYVHVQKNDVCIDAGGCLGDTSLYFMQNGAKEVYTFEIDKLNIDCLKGTVSINPYEKNIHIVESALADREGIIKYLPDPTNPGAGRIVQENYPGAYDVPVTTVDRYCEEHDIQPSFIKMDIEGSEINALKGAKNTILKYKPRLAICIYHSIDHRWEIPLLLKEWLPNYKFYVKKSHPFAETVLFGTPY